jgi:hypothetical protein
MRKYFPVRASLKSASWGCFGIFTFLMTLNYFCGMYRFGSAIYLATTTASIMGIYTYWRLRRKPADENGRVRVGPEDTVLRTNPLFVPALNRKHPLLAPTLRTGLYLACAVFTLFTVMSHLEGTPDFRRAFVGAAIAGVFGLFEGYRRAVRRHDRQERQRPKQATP